MQHTQAQTARHNPLQALLACHKTAQNKPGPEVPLVHDSQALREPQASLAHDRQVLLVQNGQVQAPEPVPEGLRPHSPAATVRVKPQALPAPASQQW